MILSFYWTEILINDIQRFNFFKNVSWILSNLKLESKPNLMMECRLTTPLEQ